MASIGIGTVLSKDGRKIGNGFLYRIRMSGKYFIETDFGNKVVLSREQVEEYFFPQTDEGLPINDYQQWLEVRDFKRK